MKEFKLGEKVRVKKYYRRTGFKPQRHHKSKARYNLTDLGKEGVWCGKRSIYIEGYSSYEGYEEGYTFVPIEHETVHLIAISTRQLIYVPDEFVEEIAKE